jgi:hypothetical protein
MNTIKLINKLINKLNRWYDIGFMQNDKEEWGYFIALLAQKFFLHHCEVRLHQIEVKHAMITYDT